MDKKDVLKQNLEQKVKQLYGNIIYNQRIHLKESIINHMILKILKITQSVLTLLTTMGLIFLCIGHQYKLLPLLTIISSISIVIILFTGNNSFENKIKTHQLTSNEYFLLKEYIELLICKMKSSSISNTMLEKEIRKIIEDYHKIREHALLTGNYAKKMTEEELNKTNEIEVTDEQLTDLLLEQ